VELQDEIFELHVVVLAMKMAPAQNPSSEDGIDLNLVYVGTVCYVQY
jgi:hypothetical protein